MPATGRGPVNLKFGLRDAVSVYPSGAHLESVAVEPCIEKVRRASLGVNMLHRYAPGVTISAIGAEGIGIPTNEEAIDS